MKSDMLDAIASGATVLTSNRRLARFLKAEFDAAQLERGLLVWRSPDILPWSSWLERCWEFLACGGRDSTGRYSRVLLNSFQELSLWERIVGAYGQAENRLLQIPATAKSAAEAWRLMQSWRVKLPLDQSFLSKDVQVFSGWAKQFESACGQSGWQDQARLPDVIAHGIRSGQVPLSGDILLAGFDEFTPQQESLFAVLEETGCKACILPADDKERNAVRVRFNDAEDEITSAAVWVRALLEKKDAARIGIVVPDLRAMRNSISRIFDDSLQPNAILPGTTGGGKRPYNISLGNSLLDYPVIHAAFLALECAEGKLPLDKAGALLRSAFLAGAESEMANRGLLDAKLRKIGEIEVPLPALRYYAQGMVGEEGVRAYACPVLAERLEKLLNVSGRVPGLRQFPSAWAATFAQVLHELGWPGERPLNSEEYQATGAWRELLDDFASLDVVLADVSFHEALGRLRRMTSEAMFQPESGDVPVQVLGVLEAANMHFDHVWVMGLHDEAWPTAAHPNPFLPLNLQRDQGLPHASASRELEFAQRITARLRDSAPDVVFSYPERDGDRSLRPSPLIQNVPEMGCTELVQAYVGGYSHHIHATRELERVLDIQGPPLPEGELAQGGTGIFKQQAACPFRAFVQYRLGVAALEEGRIGLSPSERGTLLHKALEITWDNLKSHARLCELSPEDTATLVRKAVSAAVAGMARMRPSTFTKRFTELECGRLERLITEWLAIEKLREPFAVLGSERKQSASFGGITINAKIDRVDVLENGGQVIIDYKTNQPNIKSWFGDRPDEPQLPLYSAASGEEVAAVLFAQIRLGEMAFKGVSVGEEEVPGVVAFDQTELYKEFESWKGMLGAWKGVLDRLGEDFKQGNAIVDPKKFPVTCSHCDLGSLCRIHELSNMGLLEEQGEATSD